MCRSEKTSSREGKCKEKTDGVNRKAFGSDYSLHHWVRSDSKNVDFTWSCESCAVPRTTVKKENGTWQIFNVPT